MTKLLIKTQSRQGGKAGTLTVVADLETAVKDAWLVIEAIPERLDWKREVFGELELLASEDAILATNSSSFKSREVASHLNLNTRARGEVSLCLHSIYSRIADALYGVRQSAICTTLPHLESKLLEWNSLISF